VLLLFPICYNPVFIDSPLPQKAGNLMSTRVRRLAVALFCLGLSTLLVVVSCSNKHLVSIAITPQNASVSQIGQTTQFIAMGTTNHAKAPLEDLTSTVIWSISTPNVATISSAGLAIAAGCGTTTITAQDSGVTGETTFTVTCSSTGGGNQALQSVAVLPSNPTVPQIGQTTQFLALGTLMGGGKEDLTSTATWASSNTEVATVGLNTGTVTALNCGTSTISAGFTPTDGTPIVGTTLLTVSCNSITSIELLITKSGGVVGTVTSVPTGINCGTVCGGLFNEGTGFVLTAAPAATWTGCDQMISGACYFTLVPDTVGGTQKVVTATF
jgi:hypothetical protein